MTAVFDPTNNLSNIVLVGCGGTGAQWARSIARIVYDMKRRRLHAPSITFIDPDRVEEKNVGRQLFTYGDIGQFKAEVLARRFSALGLEIEWKNRAFKPKDDTGYGTIICGAVDNHEARASIAKADGIWIDCGNSRQAAQVVIGNENSRKNWDKYISKATDDHYRYLPTAAVLFPQLLEPDTEPEPELSCADLTAIGEQQLLINDMVANVASQYLWKLLNRQPITTFMTFIDAEGLSMRSFPLTEVKDYLPEEAVA